MQATDWKPLDLYGAYRRGYITEERYAAITDEGSATVKERRKVVNMPTAERHPIWRAAVEDGWVGIYNDQGYEEERQYFLREVITDAMQKENAAGAGLASIQPISVRAMMETPPPPLDFVIGSFLAGTVGILTAPGATGKSFFALELAIDIATGSNILGLEPKIGGVTYLMLEDALPVIEHRVHDIGKHVAPEHRERLDDNLTLMPCIGTRVDVETEAEWIIEHCNRQRLIIIDTLSKAHAREENSNPEMSALIVKLDRIALKTGAAVLFIHHISKGADGSSQHAARGASAITDGTKWGGFIEKLSKDQAGSYLKDGSPIDPGDAWLYVRFNESKVNYGPLHDDHWYKRAADTGVLLPAPGVERKSKERQGAGSKGGKKKGKTKTAPEEENGNNYYATKNGEVCNPEWNNREDF